MKFRWRVGTDSSIASRGWTVDDVKIYTCVANLNDTGITTFSNDTQNGLATEPTTHPRQDASQGRDAAAAAGRLTKVGGGGAGFDFTKIANNGTVLPASAALGTAPGAWACTRDNVTGLIWEVKTNTSGLRNQFHSYTWYNSNAATNGGAVGAASGGTCFVNGRCDTEKFVQDVNAAHLCGSSASSPWRMPTVKELEGIIDFSHDDPTIDAAYFPNTQGFPFWSGSPRAEDSTSAWHVGFQRGYVNV